MAKITSVGLIAKKVGMSRIVDGHGKIVPVTLLQVATQTVTKVLTQEVNGYDAIQIGYAYAAKRKLSKADLGRLQAQDSDELLATRFREFRLSPEAVANVEKNAPVTVRDFEDIGSVDIVGISKGRGTQGAVKRWGSAIGRMTHGSRFHRRPGSLGQCTSPGRVFKNKHQPGQYGDQAVTVKNLDVMQVDMEREIIVVKGSVPGFSNGYLEVRPTNKK